MSDWFRTRLDPEAELKVADDLLNKADALLRRHKGSEREPDVEVSLEDEDLPILTEVVTPLDDDVPVLTEEVHIPPAPAEPAVMRPAPEPEPEPAPAYDATAAAATASRAASDAAALAAAEAAAEAAQAAAEAAATAASEAVAEASIALAEDLINLDTEIAREVEAWFAQEMPQLLSRELDRLAEQLRAEALAHLRATLLPTLSEHISRRLEALPGIKR